MLVSEIADDSELSFRQLNLSEPLIQAVESSGYTVPTPIQARTIPLLLAGRDVLGQAQTGTGKTAAFALPLLDRIELDRRQPQVLVLAPTRELAIQVSEAFEKYSAHMKGLRVVPIYGGQDYQIQFRQLDRGVHIVVGTPGRVMDHMRRGSLKLEGLRCLVLDEADEMLRMGFAEDVEWILTQAPAERQIALFSATLPEPIRRIAKQHLRNPAQVTIEQRTATADTIRQRFVITPSHQKDAILARILESEPIDGVLVFVKTKVSTEPVAEHLNSCGHRAVALNGDMPQKSRERIIENLKSGKVNIVVATDVAARGLDVQRISHVINYDLPHDSEAYVHRIGRTGRAGRSGEAILFVHPRERRSLSRVEHATRQRIEPMEIPTNRVINKQRIANFHNRITEALTHPEVETFASIIEQYRRDKDITIEQIAAALAIMANDGNSLLLKDEPLAQRFSDSGASHHDRGSRERFEHDRGGRDNGGRDAGGHRDASRSGGNREFDDRPRGRGRRDDAEMETFRIEVGREHQVQPGNIVGAIANETGINSSFIGRIAIMDDHTLVDLPQGMPPEMFQLLKGVRVAGCPLNITRLNEPRPEKRLEKRAEPRTEKRPEPRAESRAESPVETLPKPKRKPVSKPAAAKPTDAAKPKVKKPKRKKEIAKA